ncbi:hypothetical protein PtA15_14A12 [Puccinia triticina]|uniref:Serine/threonine-protein kinase Tel1 n=1 Tax=Puccinia triticina TaxID=208348 RepID=A0ABY7D388_9BASI|nr:uncharacterized protein PtA15_14A12 [Puccinia triticina]WAQ91132.1 hypothetical protein PtA15_14A12 [Puccinia triticina]
MAPHNTRISPLDEALSLLASSTVTDRNKGIEQISDLLANPSNLKSMKESRWAEIFHHLFSAADTEKSAMLKPSNARKGSVARASNLNRLRAALALIRKCVAHFVSQFKHKVMKLVINRTMELIVITSNRTLMDAIVPDCIRILRDFLSYRPHLEHLDHGLSAEILAICFASILDRKLPESFRILDNESFAVEPTWIRSTATDRSQAASQRMIDSAQLLSIVLPASSSVCLECSKSLLFDFRQVLENFPRETSAHFHLTSALHLLLRELELNKGRDLSRSAISLGNYLISLWPSKNIALKEQIVLCLTYLLPFVIREAQLNLKNSESQASPNAEDVVKKVSHVISNDAELHAKSSSISLGTLRLVVPPTGLDSSLFGTKGFSRTHCDGVDMATERTQAITWGALRLGASALNHLTHSTNQPSTRALEISSKRRKVESELEIFLQDMQPGSPSAFIVHRIQFLTITVDLHWKNLDYQSRCKITQSVLELLPSDDPMVMNWAFIFFGSMAHCIVLPGSLSSSHRETLLADSSVPNTKDWEQIWSYAIHRTSNPLCTRAASYAAFCILITNRIPVHATYHAIHGFLRDLDVQGPPFPCDSVCVLISECLALASENLQLSAYGLEENVLRWLNKAWPEVDRSVATWNSLGGSHQRNRRLLPEGFDSQAAFQLLVSITKLPEVTLSTPMEVPPDCATTDAFTYIKATQSTRSSIFPCSQYHIPELDAKAYPRTSNVRTSPPADDSSYPHFKPEISAILRRSMENLSQEFEGGQRNIEKIISAVPCSHLQMIIKMLIVAVLFEASCQASDSAFHPESVKSIVSVFDATVRLVGSSKWSPPERARLLTCFEPIILPSVDRSATIPFDGLAQPGAASGIALKHRSNLELGKSNSDGRLLVGSVPSQLHYEIAPSQVWSASLVMRPQLEALSKMCERLLQSVSSMTTSTTPGNATETHLVHTQATGTTIDFEEEDEDVVVGDSLPTHGGSTADNSDGSMKRNFRTGLGSIWTERATLVVTSVCVRTIITCARSLSHPPKSVCPLPLLSTMSDCVGFEMVYVGSPVVECILGGWITLAADEADQLLQHIGDTYLSTYAYSQNIGMRKFSLRVVQATLPHWQDAAEDIQKDVEVTAHQLLEYMNSQMLQGKLRSWEVQCELSCLLDACTQSNLPQTSWAPFTIEGDQDVVSSRPSDLMLRFLEDQDYRVRYRAALFVSRPFELAHSANVYPVEYWRQVVQHLDLCLTSGQLELLLTATLSMVNIFVVNEEIRPRVYDQLLQLLRDPPTCPDKALHYQLGYGLLGRASCQLGFTSTIDLYKFYAAHIVRVQLEKQESPLMCTEHCVGYRLKRHESEELVYGHFLAVGPFLYIDDQESFKKCADAATLKEDDALRLCSPAIAAELLARACTQIASMDCTPNGIDEIVEPTLKIMGKKLKLQRGIMQTESERVIVHLMRLVHVSPEDLDMISSRLIQDTAQRNVFEVLNSSLREKTVCEPALPFYPILHIAQGIKWLGDRHSLFTKPALVYNVLCQTFASLACCHFTNDRLRILHSLSIYVSLSHCTISCSLPILSLIIQALTPLISNDDIFQSVCKFAQWTILKALQPSNANLKGHASMGPLIISVADSMKQLADSTSSLPSDIICATEFNSWLLAHVTNTRKLGTTEYQKLCHSLLFHWPESHEIQVEDGAIKSVLGSSTGLEFKLIHHLHARNFPESTTETGNILYSLLASAQNLKTEIKIEDCQAYLKLLYQNSGVLISPRLGESTHNKSNASLEERSLDSEPEIISQIYALVVSHLQTYDFQLLCSLTNFLRRASILEVLPHFTGSRFSLAPLLIEKARLTCHHSEYLEYPVHRVSKPRHVPDFTSLVQLADSPHHWTLGFLNLLIASRAQARQFYVQLIPLIEMNDELAAKLLPQVLHSCLLEEIDSAESNMRKTVSSHIQTILASHSTHRDVVIRVLELVIYLRFHLRPGQNPLGNNTWLDIPWLELAKHATQWRMAASAFLFIEIAREEGLLIDVSKPLNGDLQSLLERLYSISPEPDAFYSLIPSNPTNFLLQRYQHEHQWASAFAYHGALLEGASIKSQTFCEEMPSLAGYLSGNGLNRLAHMVLHTHSLSQDPSKTYDTETENSSTLPFELAWRASVWDLPAVNRLGVDSSTRVYSSLKSCYRDRETSARINATSNCLLGQFKELIKITADRVQPSSQDIGSALALSDILNWLKDPRKDDFESLVSLPPSCQYNVLERVSAVRRSLLQIVIEQKQSEVAQDKARRTAAREAELKLRIRTSQAARHSGNVQAAVNIIVPSSNLTDKELGDTILQAKEEFARVLWAKGEQALALNIMKEVQAVQKKLPDSAVQLCQIGEWISIARLSAPTEIVDQYFEKAIQSLDSSQYPEALGEISYSYAKFADQQYHKMHDSEEMKKLKKSTKRLQAEIKGAAKLAKVDGGAKKVKALKERLLEEDSDRLDSLSKLQTRYLSSSLNMYLSCLSHGDKRDQVIFRFVSLWLEHHSDDALNKAIFTQLNLVPTHKFIPVANQLSARLSKQSCSEFQKALGHLIVQLSQDHPFHILFQILLLQRGIESSCLDSLNTSRSRRTSNITSANTLSPADRSRAEAANSVLSEIVRNGPRQKVIKELLMVHKAYKEWASYPLKAGKNPPKPGTRAQIPAHLSVNSLKDLIVPISTLRIPIDKTRRYIPESMPCINSYDAPFTVASGKSTPKITTCRDSNGISYKQLFKGGDDTRQDAIMEQVFELVNNVLERDPECQKRRLSFKTYIVIPLSPDTGLIEFVKNTSSLLDILKPVHVKYNEPPDWSLKRLWEYVAARGSADERITRYQEVITHCRPAMRFWFWESQKCPQKWYEMRLNFTRSAATTSIVGHILGLGDRHLSNILLDQVTGEVVQIDLGVAFDAGKLLPIPELVPFRLTRDIVDGFGVAKTEGVFRRCCEQTLRVLRENKWLIMTILDVLKQDPLQSWIVSKQEEKIKQGAKQDAECSGEEDQESFEQSITEAPEQASRALASVEEKLSSNLSVETTVNQLILEATSVENLGSIYCGWNAFY